MPKKDGAATAEIVRSEERDLERLKDIEFELHQKAAEIVGCALLAPDLVAGLTPADGPQMPGIWKHEMGNERAERAFIIAKAAWASQKDAPIFLKLAQTFLVGSMKARQENAGPKVINATLVQMTVPAPVFPERVMTDDDDK